MNFNKTITSNHLTVCLGEVNDDINFTYDANTQVYASCAASLDGEMFVLGGWNQKRQVNFLRVEEIRSKVRIKTNISDEQNSKLWIKKYWRIAFRLSGWCM